MGQDAQKETVVFFDYLISTHRNWSTFHIEHNLSIAIDFYRAAVDRH